MIVGKVQEVYAACKVFSHDVVKDLFYCQVFIFEILHLFPVGSVLMALKNKDNNGINKKIEFLV